MTEKEKAHFYIDGRQVIGKPEIIKVTPAIQKKMDKAAKLLSKNSKS